MNRDAAKGIAITATGLVSRVGIGLEAHVRALFDESLGRASLGAAQSVFLGGSMEGFNPVPHLSDRKMMKAVSATDAIGLVALEDLKKKLPAPLDPWRCGFYVGAPSAFASDNENYLDAVTASADYDGHVSMVKFGQECMSSRPNTLLIGLPNNVLCYGSVLLGIQGPNSNYTSGEMSGVIALAAAARRLRRGQVDGAVAGAFSAQYERIISRVFDYYGVGRSTTPTTDAGAFVALTRAEDRASEADRPPLGFLMGFGFGSAEISLAFTAESHDAAQSTTDEAMLEATQIAIEAALADAGVTTDDVGLILAGSTGISGLDRREFLVLSRVFAKGRSLPALGCLSSVMGNLMETGGIFELVLGGEIWRRGYVPAHLRPKANDGDRLIEGFPAELDRAPGRVTLVVRTSPWGEAAAFVVRY